MGSLTAQGRIARTRMYGRLAYYTSAVLITCCLAGIVDAFYENLYRAGDSLSQLRPVFGVSLYIGWPSAILFAFLLKLLTSATRQVRIWHYIALGATLAPLLPFCMHEIVLLTESAPKNLYLGFAEWLLFFGPYVLGKTMRDRPVSIIFIAGIGGLIGLILWSITKCFEPRNPKSTVGAVSGLDSDVTPS